MTNSISTPILKRLLASHILFTFARQLLRIFISIYIWDLTQSIHDVALFNVSFLFFHSVFFHLWGGIAKRGYTNELKQIGIAGLIVFYFYLFYIGESAADLMIPIAIFWGCFNSMYWLGYHIQNFDLTNNKNRGNYSGTERSLRIFVKLTAPVLGGYLITANFFDLGYGPLFLVGAMIQLIAFVLCRVDIKRTNYGKMHMIQSAKEILSHQGIRRTLYSGILANMSYIRVLAELLSLFLFVTLRNEFEVGGWLSFFTFLSVVSTFTFGKRIAYNAYKKAHLVSGMLVTGSLIALIISPQFWTYIIFGSISDLFSPIMSVTRRVFSLNLFERIHHYKKHRVEYIILREWLYIGFGGVIGFIPLLFVETLTQVQLLPLLTLATLYIILSALSIFFIKEKL